MPPLSEEISAGYWGKHTATIDWCESNYEVRTTTASLEYFEFETMSLFPIQVTEYIAEFWNTITNLVIMIPPLYGMIDAYRQGFEKRCARHFTFSGRLFPRINFTYSVVSCLQVHRVLRGSPHHRNRFLAVPHDSNLRNAATGRDPHGSRKRHFYLLPGSGNSALQCTRN